MRKIRRRKRVSENVYGSIKGSVYIFFRRITIIRLLLFDIENNLILLWLFTIRLTTEEDLEDVISFYNTKK